MTDPAVTSLLSRLGAGDRAAGDALFEATYHELRRLARAQLRRERTNHTLNATGLVHEFWLKLVRHRRPAFENRAHFFGTASKAMRRLLVDHARARWAQRRRGERIPLTGVDEALSTTPPMHDVLAVDAALESLAAINERVVRVVECRVFAGFTIPETADALGVSHATVSEDWRFGRAWLQRALSPGSNGRAA